MRTWCENRRNMGVHRGVTSRRLSLSVRVRGLCKSAASRRKSRGRRSRFMPPNRALRMERLWSLAGATSGNRWQIGAARKPRNKPKPLPSVAAGCHRAWMVRRGSPVRVRRRASLTGTQASERASLTPGTHPRREEQHLDEIGERQATRVAHEREVLGRVQPAPVPSPHVCTSPAFQRPQRLFGHARGNTVLPCMAGDPPLEGGPQAHMASAWMLSEDREGGPVINDGR